MISFEKRLEPKTGLRLLVSLISVILAFAFGGLLILIIGINPIEAYRALFHGAFGTSYGLSETLVKSIPLILCGLSVAICLKMKLWNIGAEGQFVMGFLAAAVVALRFDAPVWIMLPLLLATGFLAGALWAGIAGLLKATMNVNEIITTLLMNWVAILLSQFFAYGPLKGPDGFPHSAEFYLAEQLPQLGWNRLHCGIFLAVVVAVVLYYILKKTVWGFEVNVIGSNEAAARAAGMKIRKNIILVLFLAGGLAGIAGVIEVCGIEHRLTPHTASGYGYTAILVAWLARTNSLLVVVVAFLFGGLLTGGEMIQITVGVPIAVIRILEGAILFFLLAGDLMMQYKIILKKVPKVR